MRRIISSAITPAKITAPIIGKFELGRDAGYIDGIVEQPHDRRANDDPQNRPLATAQRTTSQHGRGNCIQLVEIAVCSRLHRVDVESKQDAPQASGA